MLPILVSWGPIKIYSYGVFLALGLFAGLYWWWKIGRDEHWDETTLFDSYFLALFGYFLSGRGVYVLMHGELYSPIKAMAILAYPGINVIAGLLGAWIVMFLLARKNGWELWKVFDVVSGGCSTILMIAGVGAVLNGSNPGMPASWGIMYPGGSERRVPIDIWALIWAMLSFVVVSRVRKYFRFYSWYKGEASVAKDGLAGLIFVGLSGLYLAVAALLSSRTIVWGVAILLFAGCMIYLRSGKNRGEELLAKIRRRK